MEPAPIHSPRCHELHHRHPSGLVVRERVAFVRERRGNPLGLFPELSIQGRPYNLWLTEQALDPVLARWDRNRPGERLAAAAVANDVEWASGHGRAAFKEILPIAAGLGDPAILAAMGVTANLQRTLAILGEFIVDGRRPAVHHGPSFRLSRLWCGLAAYGKNAPYFPARMHPPAHASRLNPRRRDPRHLGNAFWCSVGEINRRCDETLVFLRHEIHRQGFFVPDDLRHL